MLTPSEKAQLDRIEAKLDRLLAFLTPSSLSPALNAESAVFAAGGVKALKEYIEAESHQRAAAYAAQNQQYSKSFRERCEDATRRLEAARAARRQGELDDQEIRAASEKMPPELRPHPDQYKSLSRKKQVLKMVQDPTRWAEIPGLSRQWVKKNKVRIDAKK